MLTALVGRRPPATTNTIEPRAIESAAATDAVRGDRLGADRTSQSTVFGLLLLDEPLWGGRLLEGIACLVHQAVSKGCLSTFVGSTASLLGVGCDRSTVGELVSASGDFPYGCDATTLRPTSRSALCPWSNDETDKRGHSACIGIF